ncbi:hypothetical protein ACFV3E_41365 [Streptomyces sp. NPDC059718]
MVEPGVIAGAEGEGCGELCDEIGEFGHLGTGGEVPHERGVLVPQVVGTGQDKAGEPAGRGDRSVALGTTLGDAAVEERAAAGGAQLFDLAEALEHEDGGVGCPAFV